jgi:hypothetical protein
MIILDSITMDPIMPIELLNKVKIIQMMLRFGQLLTINLEI